MPKSAQNKKKITIAKSQEIIFKEPSLFRKVVSFVTAYCMMLLNVTPVYAATSITNVNGNNGVYNIEAAKISGDTGFRQYTDFTLDEGDVANLQFTKGGQDYGKFVNMVDNQVNINGIVNTVRGDAFYNGHAIFVSPNGIVVGASGVLNVGALTMATPGSDQYNAMKTAYDGSGLNNYEVGTDKYKELLSSSAGTITVNGKIMSKGDVELYGKSIKIEGKEGNRAGIIAGADIQNKVNKDNAKAVFDSLVSSNITNANSFTLSDGKVKIVAQGKAGTTDSKAVNATVNVKKADLGAKEVSIEAKVETVKEVTANTIKEYNENNNNNNNNGDKKDETTGYKIPDSFRGSAPQAIATVTVEDSVVRAEKIAITADASNKTKTYIQLLDPIWEKWLSALGVDILTKILIALDAGDELPADVPFSSYLMVKQYFSDETYSYMDGANASSAVMLTNAAIDAKNSVDVSANAEATTDISTGELDSHALFFYGLGAKTDAKVNVSGSTIKTLTGDEKEINIEATSEIDNKIKYDSSKFLAITDKPQENNNNSNNNNNNNNNNNGGQQSTVSAYNLVLLNNSIVADTAVNIAENSTIETGDLTVKAIDFNSSEVEVKDISNVGENSDKTGIAAAMVINHTKTDSNVSVKDSTITADGDVKTLAQNINVIDSSVETEVKAKNQTYDVKTKELSTAGKTYTIKAYEWLNKKFLGKVTDKIGDVLDKANLEISGSAIWNNEHNSSTAQIDNSNVSGDNISVLSNMVDFAVNSAEADAGAEKKISAGVAIVVNDQNNTNEAKIINGSTVEADKDIMVSATTQLPMNPLGLTFGQEVGEGEKKVNMFIGVGFDSSTGSPTSWDADFLHTKVDDILNKDNAQKIWNSLKSPLKFIGSSKIKLDGLFNNQVMAEGSGDTVNIAGSVLANTIATNTSAYIDGSTVTSENGNITVNASNSVVNYNGVGKVEFLIDKINKFIGKLNPGDEEEEEDTKAGIGGSVLVDHFTNNAKAYITNSKVTAENGDIEVKAASEEGYINMAVIGAKAGLFAVEGAVNVQNIDGKTEASIKNSKGDNEIKAKNIEVAAGKASISPKKSGEEDPVELDKDSGELSVNDEREVEDSVVNISLIGTNSQQEGSGVSVGAAISVAKILKEITGLVEDSKITATKDVSVTADTISRKIDVLGAAAFAGGVATSRDEQEEINNDETGTKNGQKMKNVGNWMDEMDAADDDAEDVMNLNNLFDENDANSQGKEELDKNKNGGNRNGGSANKLTGSNQTANTSTANTNFGIALAGAVDVTNDYTKTNAEIKDSTVGSGEDVKVAANNDTLAVQVNGGLSKSSTIAGGAGVNVYNNRSETKALIDNSTITETSATNSGTDTPKIKVEATTDIDLIDVTAGISIAAKDGFKASAGGAFGFNKLQNTVWAKILNNSIVQKAENAADVDVTVNAKDDSHIWNIAGAAGIQSGSGANIGGGIAVTRDFSKKDIVAEVNNSTLLNAKDVSINADLDQDFNTVAVAGEISVGSSSSYTFDGALNSESNLNSVIAKAINSEITSSGDVKIIADEAIVNQSLAGAIEFSTAQSGFGVGIGAVVNVNDSTVKAEADNAKIHKSGSITINAQETENLKFLAANLGIQTAGGVAVNVNGVVNVFVSNVIAHAINNSVLSSDGNVAIDANYDNWLRGITSSLSISMASNAGANLIGNGYNNRVTAELQNGSEIKKAQNVTVNADSIEKIDLIPVGVSVAFNENATAAVAANINANVFKNTVQALLNGKVSESSAVLVNAVDDTTIYTRGGTVSGGLATAEIAGSVNVDVVKKTIHAYVNGANVKTSGDMAVLASSVNSMGGTKDSDGKYITSDVTASGYKDSLLNKNEKGEYVGLKQDSNFGNWNMFYDLSGSMTASVAGAVIIKTIGNEVEAKIVNSETEADNLQVAANDYSIKNIIAGAIGGALSGAVGVQVLVLNDDSNTKAFIGDNSKLTIADTITLNAVNRKDNQQILIAASGAGTVAANVNTFVNNIDDKATASIDNANGANEISAQTIDINADETINASHIAVTGSGAGHVALSVAPVVNNYNGTTEASIKNAKVNNAAIDMDAKNKLETLDISVGVSGVGQGLAGTGIAIKNNYTNTIKSYIENAVINTTSDISIDADAIIKAENWIASLSVAGQGVGIIVNVILNTVISDVEAGIKNSNIKEAGNIAINANKNKQDRIYNRAIGLGVAGQGVSALANVVQNIYTNTVKSYVENTSSTAINSLDVAAYSDRKLENINYGLSVAGMGASLLANTLVNQIDSVTRAYIDAKAKELNVANAISVYANDKNEAENVMAMINGAGAGAAAGANINLYYANNTAKAEVLSEQNGQINAGSSDIQAVMTNGLDNLNAAVSLGAGAIAGDVALIRLGKRTDTYSTAETSSKINNAVSHTKDQYDKITANDTIKGKYTPTSSSDSVKTGAISSVNGNLKTANNTEINASSQLKGLGNKEKLELSNTNISAGLATVGVGIKNTQLANNTIAEIAGGTVESTSGDVSVKANSKSDVEIKNVRVDVSGVSVSGGSAIYNNSSETVAQIKDATVNTGGDIEVVSQSTSNSNLDSTNVVVTGVGVVSVDLSEAKDTNKSVALISGDTNINASGKLTLHSTATTDLKSTKATVTIAGAEAVGISKNEANASTINRAIIENVTGTINTNGLDIITDYNKMSVLSKANVTSVKLASVFSDDISGAVMNANFKSGIDSTSGLILNNLGTTSIITAKDNGTDGITAKGEVHNVHVSLQGFVAATSAKAENTATVSTVLKAKEHNANNLEINSSLASKAISNAGSVKATVGIGVNVVTVDAKDVSTMSVDVGGANKINQNATINASHVSDVISDMSAFNFGGLVGGGQRVRINSTLTANTTGNIGGDFNANSASIDFNTIRNSVLSKSSGSGAGVLNISDTKAVSLLTGSSVLTVDGINTDSNAANNRLTVKNTSTNTFDVTSSDGAGGIISVSKNNTTNTFNTSTITNLNSSNINSKNKVEFEVKNNSVVKDTASMRAGGFVAVADTEAYNSYTSAAKLSLNNTTINAETVNLKASSDIRTKNEGVVDYVGGAGGFVAENEMKLTNVITQTSEIDIQNSKLYATKDIVLNVLTSSMFRQRTANNVGGFVAIPRSKNWLTVTNNNRISIDATSKLKATDELEIEFDSQNNLEARAKSEAHHFGFKDPVAESYLTLTVNNVLQNNGSIESGNLVDINYMTNSANYLTQYAYSEAHAAIPTTSEDGRLVKNINNVLNVEAGADITSGKDIEISYSSGKGSSSSTIAYKSVCYALFGIPISKSGSKSNASNYHSPSLKDDGAIVAGQGNSRYMKINRDGTIDQDTLKGFYSDDYIVYDGQNVDGDKVKEQNLAAIVLEIENADEKIGELETIVNDLEAKIDNLTNQKTAAEEELNELKDLLPDHELVTEEQLANKLYDIVKGKVVDDSSSPAEDKISSDKYTEIANAYDAKVAEINVYNNGHLPQDQKPVPTISEFLSNHDYELTSEEKTTVETYYDVLKTIPEDYANYVTMMNEYNTSVVEEQQKPILTAGEYIRSNYKDYDDNIRESFASVYDKLSTISSDYKAELKSIDEWNNGHADNIEVPLLREFLEDNKDSLGLSTVQADSVSAAFDDVIAGYSATSHGYVVYNVYNNKYVIVENPNPAGETGTSQTCDEIEQLKTKLTDIDNQISLYTEDKTANDNILADLRAEKDALNNRYREISESDPKDYEQGNSLYSVVFNALNQKSSRINVEGAYNYNITGNGIFDVVSSGIRVDNYSTRTLIFSDLNIDSTTNSGLIIGGRNHSEFMNKEQAVSGWDAYNYMFSNWDHKTLSELSKVGVHYVNGGKDIEGININNYYDVNHPFVSTFTDIPFPTQKSDIFFVGNIQTENNLNVLNESGRIGFVIADWVLQGNTETPIDQIVENDIKVKNMSLVATNDVVGIVLKDNNDTPETFYIKDGDYIFARDGFTVMTNRGVDIKGTIKTGYSNRNITITDEMIAPENLIVDVTSGEKNMIDLGTTNVSPYLNEVNNIKAIYKDGQIYLYNIPEVYADNGLTFYTLTEVDIYSDAITIGDNAQIIVANGYQKINIDNQTSAQMNVNEITNAKFSGTGSVADNYGDKITMNTLSGADTTIKSTGKLVLDGIIKNNVDSDQQHGILDGGTLKIEANNGLDIKKHAKVDGENAVTIDSISAGGLVDITVKGGEALLAGDITAKGNVEIYNYGDEKIDINGNITNQAGDVNIENAGAGKLTINGRIIDSEGDINILGTGTGVTELTNAIYAVLGDVFIASKGLTATADSTITADEGDISIINNAGNLDLKGIVIAQEGDLSVQNNGTSATVAGSLSDEKGDLTIINNKGDMTITSAIYHNYVDNTAEGMITIINNPDAEKLDIQVAIQTYGAGKTEGEKTTAILIDNRSTTTGMTIANAVTARVGDIIIRNAAKNLTVSSVISNTEQGNIGIYNAGENLQTTSNIVNTKGDTTIANSGSGTTSVGGSILNKDGNTAISGSGTMLEISGTVDNTGGNTAITNSGGQMRIVGNVTNKGGDITATNTGSSAEITSVVSNKGGSINITNSNGNLNIGADAQILNNTDDANDGITISNSGADLDIAGVVNSTDKGDIKITNSGAVANLKNRIYAAEGNIDITNSNAGALKITGDIVDDKGSVSITNSSADGANIGGTISDEQGDVTITNNGGALKVTSDITHNKTNNNTKGMITIINDADAGAVDINAEIATYGAGKTEGEKTTAILIDNRSTTTGMAIANAVTARVGDIIIKNAAQALALSADIENTEEGNISVANAGGDTTVTGDITAHKGNIGITNDNAGNLNIEGSSVVTEDAGNIDIYNSGGKLSIVDAWLETETAGNITITNEGTDDTSVSGDIVTDKGNIAISNNSKNLKIAANVSANEGDIKIDNFGVDLEITEDAAVTTETEGDIAINNKGSGDLTVAGDVTTETTGDILINNKGKKLTVSGDITTDEGNIDVVNEGTDGTSVSGDVTATIGDITVANKSKTLDISGDISTDKGNVDIKNSSTDSGTTISGDVATDEGNIGIENNGDKLTVSGDITDIKGNINIKNNGETGTEISQKVLANEGNITISNTAGELSLTSTSDVTADKGDISISNTATDKGTNLTGKVLAKKGDIAVENGGAKLTVSGQISDNNGKIDITNNGANGTEFSSSAKITNDKANTTVTNNKGDLTVAEGAEIKNTESGDIKLESKEGVFSIAGKVAHAGTGNIELNNSGSESFELASTGELKATKGNISITNTGAKGAAIAGTITDKDGNTTIDNQNGLTYTAALENSGGNTTISNTGDADMSGSISNTGGNTSIANTGGALNLASTVNNDGGNLSVTNTGNGTTISGDLDNTGGDVVIANTGKDLTFTADSTVDNNGAGNVTITNSGDGKLAMNGTVSNKVSGDTSITNTGENGAEITGTITNTQGDLTVQNQKSDLVFAEGSVVKNLVSGEMKIENTAEARALTVAGELDNAGSGNIVAENRGADEFTVTPSGKIHAAEGDIALANSNDGGLQIAGQVVADNGKTTIDNTSKDGMTVATSGQIIDKNGDIELNNNGAAGMKIEGKVLAEKQNITINNQDSDLIIGELDSANDNYVEATIGNVVIAQASGDVLNGIVDTSDGKHQNADLGNPQQSYKTLIVAGKDLTMNVTDGDIGYTDNANPGFSINASTRDWTDSVNIKVDGDVTAIGANDNNSDARLINLRAKDSDLNVKNVTADGNVMLTAADWKQADVSPTPDDEAYFKGYSIVNTADDGAAAITGQNISVIASDNIGSADKKFKYLQDTAANPNSSISFEAENDLQVSGSTNSANDMRIYQMISKHGSLDLDLESNASIGYITAGEGLIITQKAQNLTIGEIGLSDNDRSAQDDFDDILYAHDGLVYGGGDSSEGKGVIPKYAMISALDAIDNPDRGDSNLKIYSMTVRGNNGDNADYYSDGGRLADVTLMADNIYANSDKAPDSNVSTKANPDGYKQTETSYNDEIFGGKGEIHNAKGINAYGDGTPLSLDVLGVDKDIVASEVDNPQRSEYKEQTSLIDIPSKFRNAEDSIYDYDFRIKNAVISVNDYADNNRGVEFDTLYADNAYVNTLDTNLTIHDGYVNNYAELRNGNHDSDSSRYLVVVDNDYRRLVPSNVQLYTQKTGSFALMMSDLIKFMSPAPVVHYNWDKLVNTFSDENSFVRLGLKETEIRQKAKKYHDYGNIYVMPENPSMTYEVWRDGALVASVKIMEISRYGAIIVNHDNWQVGEEHEIELAIDGSKAKIRCVVAKVKRNLATVEFADMPAEIANKIAYRYMITAQK